MWKSGILAKANVFINNPFLYGDEVYALGNKYYVKNRHIHRYNIKDKLWSVVF